MVEIKVKRLQPTVDLPIKTAPNTYDIWASSMDVNEEKLLFVCKTGLAFDIPDGYIGLVFPRYRNTEFHMCLGNSVGIIHPGNGDKELILKFRLTSTRYVPTDNEDDTNMELVIQGHPSLPARVGQLIVLPLPTTVLIEKE